MSRFAGRGLELQEILQSVVRRWRPIRCLVLVDETGLPLASSLVSRSMEERLAAFVASARSLMLRGHADLRTGAVHLLHLASQDRQVVVIPVDAQTLLAAVLEADASVADVSRQLATTARCVLDDRWPREGDDEAMTTEVPDA